MRLWLYSKYIYLGAIIIISIITTILLVGIFQQPLKTTETICLFNTNEDCIGLSGHFIQWQNISTVSPELYILYILVVLLITLSTLLVSSIPQSKESVYFKKKFELFLRLRQRISTLLFNYLIFIFSKGLIHPKLF